jgi:hypothetical protein
VTWRDSFVESWRETVALLKSATVWLAFLMLVVAGATIWGMVS